MVKIFIALILLASLSACRLTTSAYPNVIIIAVDKLGVNQANCAKESHLQKSGIELLCQESVRFTHAFTTSPLSVPAMASVLTGQYPYQHKVRTNGKDFLPSQMITPTELAQRQGVATAFFSGGAPILRKSNLHQGFEVFDDHLNPTMNRMFRPFAKTQKLFENWIREVGRQSFLAVFYVPDLTYTETQTQTELGEIRNLTFDSQMEEFDSTLFRLFQFLKTQKLWDNTQIVLVGLNGPGNEDRAEISNLNLFSERTHVGLLVKPPQKSSRDEVLKWSVDSNVTIADIGASLQKLYAGALVLPQGEFERDFPVWPLPGGRKENAERPILLESAWGQWQAGAPIRYAIRWDSFLVLYNQRPQVFNSLDDHLETSPSHSPESGRIYSQSLQLAEKWKWPRWSELPRETIIKWMGLAVKQPGLERLAHRLRFDQEIASLYGLDLLNKQNWAVLHRWAQGNGLKEMELIAMKNLNLPVGKSGFSKGCLAKDPQTCDEPISLALLEWVNADIREDSTKENARMKFLRLYFQQKLDEAITAQNWRQQGVWDISNRLRQDIPVVEKLLALPEMQKYRQIAWRALQQIREE